AAALATLAGCQGTSSRGGDLTQRPLFTFDESEVDTYLRIAREIEPELGKRVVHLGRKNIGQPYDIYLLGEFPYEYYDAEPIYCLNKSDCLVFSEHMYSMALSRDWWEFLRTLQRIRYRDGIISMLTRNHYGLADWNPNNAFLFEDMTTKLGGGQASVPLHQVCRRAKFFEKYGIGQDIPDQPIADHYIPKERIPEIASELRDGDFVNIVRGSAESQWVGHTGLIAIAPDGTPDFLHSAKPAVREQPLVEYVNGDTRCVGIKILRLRPDAEKIMAETLENSPLATPVSEGALLAALQASPLVGPGTPPSFMYDWAGAMHRQAYRIEYDTPVDAELQATLEKIDKAIGGELGIPEDERAFGVLDLSDLRLALVRPDSMFYAASVPKICIALAYFETYPEAIDNLDPEVERELKLMIKHSDNELAPKYCGLIGIDKILEIIQSKKYGFYDQEHGGGLWCGKPYGPSDIRIGDPLMDHSHAATVRQCLRYYLMMEQGRLVNVAASARLKEIFAAPEFEHGQAKFVKGLAGRPVYILRKSGTWEDWRLDTARVTHADRVYLLAGMTHHPQGDEYLARMAAAIDDALCGE
ncbi:MAG: DUF1460 domain-containing protein, partial [Phycisphaerae bacterium]|nr:DUF1460 domain-containing protein [Phycisphaerae bacterium]